MHPDVDASAMRGLLEARRVTLRESDELGGDGKATVELDQTSVGRVSRIDALQAQQLALAAAPATKRTSDDGGNSGPPGRWEYVHNVPGVFLWLPGRA